MCSKCLSMSSWLLEVCEFGAAGGSCGEGRQVGGSQERGECQDIGTEQVRARDRACACDSFWEAHSTSYHPQA